MRKLKMIFVVMVILALLAMPLVAFAQDAEATDDVPVVTVVTDVEADVAETVGADVEAVVPLDSAGFIVNTSQMIGGLIAAFAAGGLVGTGGVVVFVNRIRNDEVTKTAVEHLAMSLPVSTLGTLRDILAGVDATVQLLQDVTDGDPNT